MASPPWPGRSTCIEWPRNAPRHHACRDAARQSLGGDAPTHTLVWVSTTSALPVYENGFGSNVRKIEQFAIRDAQRRSAGFDTASPA
ncbi:hypothetical protein V5279_12325 [Bradyrhizobium sp. 26S5]|jgi:hypothetical protein|uniref:hypothetical protein n=1 Tax=Bradyrhizobium sp. 26S5 TaxID=3139729 RepID=UPI0030CBE5AA